jgi:beta-barrel assembly-enhancing protease
MSKLSQKILHTLFLTTNILVIALLPIQIQAQVNLPTLGDSVSGVISTQQEYEFGRELLRSMRRETNSLNDPLMEAYISSVTYKLAVKSELTDHRLEFLLIDNEALNAFAAPGGIIGVNAGLFLYAENEGQFASVLAHELAHLSQRHYARNVQQARNSALPNLAATIASLVVMAADGEAGQAAMAASQAVSIDGQLRFSRDNEQEADRVGIRTLYNAGFDPADMGEMFEQMMRASTFSRRMPEFMSTHPLDENRIADSKNRTNNYPIVQYIQNIEYLLMQQRVKHHYQDDFENALSLLQDELPRLNGLEADAARYAIALTQLETGQFINATQTLDLLLNKEPNRITYVMLQSDIARKAENYDLALGILEKNLQINPNNHPLTMAYAETLIATERYTEAAELLTEHAILRPNDMNLWFLLAEVQGQAGNISEVHQARAEYYFTIGQLGRARDQLNFALSLETDRLSIARIQQRLDDIRVLGDKFYR